MTREEVEALAESARAQQKFVEAEGKLFGGGIGFGSPYFLALLAACVMLHFYNSNRETAKEAEEALLEKLRQARREPKPLSPAQREQVLAHKRHQLDKTLMERRNTTSRADKLRAEIESLEAARDAPP